MIDSALCVRSVSVSSILIIIITSVLAINRALEGIVYVSFHTFPSKMFQIYLSVRSWCPSGTINATDSKMNMQFNKQWIIKIFQSRLMISVSSVEESVHTAGSTYIVTYRWERQYNALFFVFFGGGSFFWPHPSVCSIHIQLNRRTTI